MAILLGLKLLRVAPLISSTAALMCAWDQQFAFQSFIDPKVPHERAGALLPYWLPAIFRPLIRVVVILHPLGGILGLANGLGRPGAALDDYTRWLYLAGGAVAFSHLIYGRTAMGMIFTMWDKSLPGKANLKAVGPWLRLNRSRIITSNLPAWGCFLAAVLHTFEIREI